MITFLNKNPSFQEMNGMRWTQFEMYIFLLYFASRGIPLVKCSLKEGVERRGGDRKRESCSKP